jgi:hypothetical protein
MLKINVHDEEVARTPRHLGVNIEIQDHPDRSNLWDWVMHSRASAVREFHPAKILRNEDIDISRFEAIATKDDFEELRAAFRADPVGAVPWGDYLFDQNVPWLGVPDEVAAWVGKTGVNPIISMDYVAKTFSQPLADADITDRMPDDEEWHWTAFASAYEYYFAMIYRYASRNGCCYFMMRNEPELNGANHYMPKSIRDLKLGRGQFMPLLTRAIPEWRDYAGAVTNQMAILTRAARNAMDDVKKLVDKDLASKLFLISPGWCSDLREPYWAKASQWADACDFHHYSSEADTLSRRFSGIARRAGDVGKKVTSTEFGRMSGALKISQLLFDLDHSLEAAGILMTALEMAETGLAPCEAMTFYHFRFPATHRNYKALVYGDMNLLDWLGKDTALRARGEEWYPTFEELQVRFATPAYSVFRMLARCVPGETNEGGHAVRRIGSGQFWEAEHVSVRAQAIDTGRDLVVNLLNQSDRPIPDVSLDLASCGSEYRFAVVRETSRDRRDEAVAQMPVESAHVSVDLAPTSLTQVILTPLALDSVKALRIEENSITPGGLEEGLGLWQTTHLRAVAVLDGEDVDVSDLNAVWRSSKPECLVVHQGGLVIRTRAPHSSAEVEVSTLTGGQTASVAVEQGRSVRHLTGMP